MHPRPLLPLPPHDRWSRIGSHDSSFMFTPLTTSEHGWPMALCALTCAVYHPVVSPGLSPCLCHKQSLSLKGFLSLKSRPALFRSLSVRAQHSTAKMRVSYAAIAALMTSVAYSQSVADLIGQIPSCALICLATAATIARCGFSDYACQCGPAKDAITKSATPCIASACTADAAASTSTPPSLDNPNHILDSNLPLQRS